MPECDYQASQSADRRTFTVRCIAAAGKHYEVWLNRPPYMNFREAETQTSAEPARLAFTVRGG
jgi:hypothetical protein